MFRIYFWFFTFSPSLIKRMIVIMLNIDQIRKSFQDYIDQIFSTFIKILKNFKGK